MLKFSQFSEEYLYHGTSHENAAEIKKNGLDPSKSPFKKVYLSRNHGESNKYSKIASNGKLGKVLKVHKDNLDPNHIHKDHSGVIEYTGKINPKHIEDV